MSFSGTGINVPDVTDLRVVFQVDKADGKDMNHGLIHIYNLNSDSRNQLARAVPAATPFVTNPIQVTLSAGYDDVLVQLIKGDILRAWNYRAGPDWITEIEIYSALAVASKTNISLSYNGKTSSKKILEDALVGLNLDIKYTPDAQQTLAGQTVPSYTANGNAFYEANTFLSHYNLECTIEDEGQLLIYAKYVPRDKTAIRTDSNSFTPKNGMIGTPKLNSYGANIRCLLRPEVKILQRIFVESETISATIQNDSNLTAEFYVKKITHLGDTRSDDWFTELDTYYANINAGYY